MHSNCFLFSLALFAFSFIYSTTITLYINQMATIDLSFYPSPLFLPLSVSQFVCL